MAKLDREDVVTLENLAERGVPNREIARLLRISEGNVRYHLRRKATGALDGRSNQQRTAAAFRGAIDEYLESVGEIAPSNVADLHAYLVREFAYPGSLRSLQRFVREAFPQPKVRARRRIETPPGTQAQADWAHFPAVLVGGRDTDLLAFTMVLSHSRGDVIVWSARKDLLSWLACHNEAFRRFDGVPATVRVDNEKTAVARGAGAWSVLNPAYERYAHGVRFLIDPCPPRSPEAKGKVERRIREQRHGCNPYARHWNDLAELQAWTDERTRVRWAERTNPATGRLVVDDVDRERAFLAPLPALPEPFDVSVTRRVRDDATVAFEGRTYSVPFTLARQQVEVRGCADSVQVLHEAQVVARHPRGSSERILLDPSHYDGTSTDRVQAPPPLGRMGRALAELGSMPPEQRPLDLYAALVERLA